MTDILWTPDDKMLREANVTRFMNKHGIKTYQELIQASIKDIAWFWKEALEDLNLHWQKPYQKVFWHA